MFYNTGIATYIWVLTNHKPAHRSGQVQLIDATTWFKPLRKNLGKKNCELAPEDLTRITRALLDFKETPQSKIFPNEAFGYWKISVERPQCLHSQFTKKAIESLRYGAGDEVLRRELYGRFGQKLYDAFPAIRAELEEILSRPVETREPKARRKANPTNPPCRKNAEKIARPRHLEKRPRPGRSRTPPSRGRW